MLKFNLSLSDIIFSTLKILIFVAGLYIGYKLGISTPQQVTNYEVKNKKGELILKNDTIKQKEKSFLKRIFD